MLEKNIEKRNVDRLILMGGSAALIILVVIMLFVLNGCQFVPEISKSVEEIANNDAVTVLVDKDAFQKETDVHVLVDIINKEPDPQQKTN